MDSCDYNGALSTIQMLRKQYQENPHPDIVKDVIYIEYKDSMYSIYLALVNSKGKAITMEWPIEVPFTIPKEIRDCAKEHVNRPVLLDENVW